MRLPVNVFAVTNRQHCDESARIVNLVNDPIGAGANAPRVSILQFFASRRSRILCESNQMAFDQFV
jgi:hypothetical protein